VISDLLLITILDWPFPWPCWPGDIRCTSFL